MSIPGQPPTPPAPTPTPTPTPAIPPAGTPAPERRDRPFLFILAVISLASTIGAAALAGYWANTGVQETLDRQRSAEIQDQRRAAYADFIRAAGQVCTELASSSSNSDKVNAVSVEVLTQESRVLLIASQGLRGPTENLTKYVMGKATSAGNCTTSDYTDDRDAFITSAQQDLDS